MRASCIADRPPVRSAAVRPLRNSHRRRARPWPRGSRPAARMHRVRASNVALRRSARREPFGRDVDGHDRGRPCSFASMISSRPIGPRPNTAQVSPSRSSPRRNACSATAAGSITAACSRLMPSGRRCSMYAGTTAKSAMPPSPINPAKPIDTHRLYEPERNTRTGCSDSSTATRSPARSAVTPSPTSTTVPQNVAERQRRGAARQRMRRVDRNRVRAVRIFVQVAAADPAVRDRDAHVAGRRAACRFPRDGRRAGHAIEVPACQWPPRFCGSRWFAAEPASARAARRARSRRGRTTARARIAPAADVHIANCRPYWSAAKPATVQRSRRSTHRRP